MGGQQVGTFLRSLLTVANVSPQEARFGALWISSTEVTPGETFSIRVRLHPSSPLDIRDFSVVLVGTTNAPRFARRELHSELVMMHTSRVLREDEVLEFPSERVTLPKDICDANPDARWFLKLEARLEMPRELFLREIDLPVRPPPHGIQRPAPRPVSPPAPLPPLLQTGEEERLQPTRFPVSEDLRRKLEGGIEALEAAHARYELLEKALQRKQWQQVVLERLNTLRETVHQEPEVIEALARLHQRARVEGGPGTEPALGLARELEGLRSRLGALLDTRLGKPTAREEDLAQRLARLERLLSQTLAPTVSPEEPVLLQGGFRQLPVKWSKLLRFNVLCLIVAGLSALPNPAVGLPLASLLSSLLVWRVLQRRRSGHFWLTRNRLVWRPMGKEPIHIPLPAIRPDGIRLLSSTGLEVRLVDGRAFRLLTIEDAEQLTTLLKQHRRSPDEE